VTRDPAKFAAFMKQSEAIGVVNTPEKVFALVGPDLMKEEQEVFLVIPLNLRGELKCPPYEIARGQRSRVTVGVNNVIEAAMDAHCEGILLTHNHPTGRCTPSAADRKLTDEIKRACAPYGKDLTYIDHVIIGVNQFYSIEENKLYKVK
jgi:DNA repair protein RadC